MGKKDDFGYLGEDFQFRLVHEFETDFEFFKDLSPIINQNMFTHPDLRTYVGIMKDRYDEHDVVPDYSTMRAIFGERCNNDNDIEKWNGIIEKIKNIQMNDVENMRNMAIKFFRQQNIVKTAKEIIKIAETGNDGQYERCVSLLNDAMSKGIHDDLGVNVYENIEETLSDDYRVTIPTGVEALDTTLEGGIGKGELGVIVGPSSFGKTSLTTAIASCAATYRSKQNDNSGFKVLQIVFEDRIKQIQRKHFGRITGIEAKDLSKPENIDLVNKLLDEYEDKEMLKNNLRIVRFQSGEKTADSIRRYIIKQINNGFRPDMVIIDYFECLKHTGPSSASEWDKEGITMRKFEAMAGELNIAIWIPVQGSKDSINQSIITMDKAGGSIKKIQIAHIVISIARSLDDIEANIATFCILKNRAGQSGKIFSNIYMNNGTCRINSDDACEFNSMSSFDEDKDKKRFDLQRDIMQSMKNSNS